MESIAHAMRSPVWGMSGMLQGAMSTLGGQQSPSLREDLGMVMEALERLRRMADGLAVLSSLRTRASQWTDVDLSATATEALGRLQSAEPSRCVRTVVTPGIRVRGDRTLLGQAMDNLLASAWERTRACPEARVELRIVASASTGPESPRRVVCALRDNGEAWGPAGQGQRVFEPFRGPISGSEDRLAGLGLALVRRVVHLHDGDIQDSFPAGAIFRFSLPATAVQPEEALAWQPMAA